MGRMFRILTEGTLDAPTGGPAAAAADPDPFVGGGAPFVEVGGPNGPVHSLPKPGLKPAPAPGPAKVALPTRQAVGERYLSAALRQIAPRTADPLPNAIAADVVAYHHPDHPVSAEYRALRDDLREQVGGGGKAVLLTAAAGGHGTTTVLLNLAVTLAADPGARVLAVDADFVRPGAARKLGLIDVPGLAEVLAQATPLAWAVQPTAVPRLQLLAAGKPADGTTAAMAADFPRLVGQLRQWFDWVLIDGGVWGEHPGRDALGPAFDGIYLVTREADLDDPELAALRAEVARQGGLLRGYITTKA